MHTHHHRCRHTQPASLLCSQWTDHTHTHAHTHTSTHTITHTHTHKHTQAHIPSITHTYTHTQRHVYRFVSVLWRRRCITQTDRHILSLTVFLSLPLTHTDSIHIHTQLVSFLFYFTQHNHTKTHTGGHLTVFFWVGGWTHCNRIMHWCFMYSAQTLPVFKEAQIH